MDDQVSWLLLGVMIAGSSAPILGAKSERAQRSVRKALRRAKR